MKEKILLISGVHANEVCSAKIAAQVFNELQAKNYDVELYNVPWEYTLLGVLDGDSQADTRFCIKDDGEIDTDLKGLVDEHVLNEKYPGSTTIEFHNYADTLDNKYFYIEPGLPAEDFRIGNIYDDRARYEINFWQNRSPDDSISGKYLIELPQAYVDVSEECRDRRLRNLEQLERKGHTFPRERSDFPEDLRGYMIREYVIREASIEESTQKGYLGDEILEKVLEWVLSVAGKEKG
jgi:hypothetical protein